MNKITIGSDQGFTVRGSYAKIREAQHIAAVRDILVKARASALYLMYTALLAGLLFILMAEVCSLSLIIK